MRHKILRKIRNINPLTILKPKIIHHRFNIIRIKIQLQLNKRNPQIISTYITIFILIFIAQSRK